MIVGIGTDMIEIERVIKACKNPRFIEKCYTKQEAASIAKDKKKSADNFAVKEAVAKMFGTGFRGISPMDIEVMRDELGKPFVQLYGNALELAREKQIEKIHVSITNTKKYASAFVVGEMLSSK